MMQFFKFLIMQGPLLMAAFDYHRVGEVNFEYPEPDVETTKHL